MSSLNTHSSNRPVNITFEFNKQVVEILPYMKRKLLVGFKHRLNSTIHKMAFDIIIHCIGFTGFNVDPLVPFDKERGIIKNVGGRIQLDSNCRGKLYCAGWIKNGSKGIIAHTKHDSHETVSNILEDFNNSGLLACHF